MVALNLEITSRGYVPAEEAAKVFGVTKGCLAKWRSERGGPAYYRVAGRIYYRRDDLEAFIEQSRVATTPATQSARQAELPAVSLDTVLSRATGGRQRGR